MGFRYGDSATEYYEMFVGEDLDELILVGSDDDQGNHDFYTMAEEAHGAISFLGGKTGNIDGDDLIHGPEMLISCSGC